MRRPLLVTLAMMHLWAFLCWAEHSGSSGANSGGGRQVLSNPAERGLGNLDAEAEELALAEQTRQLEELELMGEQVREAIQKINASGSAVSSGEVGETPPVENFSSGVR